jgi:imidazole glycerol-phosphate synthase subunit HisF
LWSDANLLQVRVIPALLLHDAGLVKTVKFRHPKYVGDPINAIKIFNEKAVDELVILDISASRENRGPSYTVIEEIASECFMPLGYGGGITAVDEIKRVLATGVEKVVLNSAALSGPQLIEAAARQVGSQSIVVSIDAKRKLLGGYEIYGVGGTRATGLAPATFAKHVQDAGAGEILINSIDRDGTCEGYDLALIGSVAEAVRIPVIACGGAGSLEHFRQAVDAGASAVAAGSMFVYVGKHRAVMINYPAYSALEQLFERR